MQADTVSISMNQYDQVFPTEFGRSRSHPMKKKSNTHETLSLFSKRDDVPPNTMMDGSKEQTLGSSRKKSQEADFHIN